MESVLVIDDEFGVAELIDAVLTDEGYRVLTASNGRQGLEVLATEPLGLVFLDYMMPVMDGAAMLQSMINNPSLRSIPVVMMSSMPEATVAARCPGYTAFMRKPFRITEIVALTTRLMPIEITPSA
jgi:CheY-like chemotaxis protein